MHDASLQSVQRYFHWKWNLKTLFIYVLDYFFQKCWWQFTKTCALSLFPPCLSVPILEQTPRCIFVVLNLGIQSFLWLNITSHCWIFHLVNLMWNSHFAEIRWKNDPDTQMAWNTTTQFVKNLIQKAQLLSSSPSYNVYVGFLFQWTLSSYSKSMTVSEIELRSLSDSQASAVTMSSL